MPEITEMFAFCATDDEGEGIMGMMAPNGQWHPMIGADMARVDAIRPMAREIAKIRGVSYKLKKFRLVEVIEFDTPGETDG